jgi:hypothetical protein
MFGKQPYDILTNDDLETLIENTNKTKGLEWDEYEIVGAKTDFPMWKVVTASQGDSFNDFKEHFDKTNAKAKATVNTDDSQVGVVKPEDAFKANKSLAYGDSNLIDKIAGMMKGGKNVLGDNSGVVDAKSTFSTGTKQSIENDFSVVTEPTVERAVKATPGEVGVVKPKEDMGKQTVEKPTTTAPKGTGKVGVVKPKEDMGKQTKVEITKATKAPKGDGKVGVVKPKEDLGKQTKVNIDEDATKAKGDGNVGVVKPTSTFQTKGVSAINFDKFITNDIQVK